VSVVLDEATSQVGVSMERELYLSCARLNITVLSVGHRDSLRQFHQQQLHIDQSSGRWQLVNITNDSDSAAGGDGRTTTASSSVINHVSLDILSS